ncbi:MAG: hypothetical protein HF982_08870 [Desulfobacteraceae bacterium]|nr:hypothetical protein [Desulfobacteraceae bacterium]MBC2719682.1 hypothetical protein [Desulfobacteraceae bacterium]
MASLYELDRTSVPVIQPQIFPLKEDIYHIFAVPEYNAIGTNDLDNAITLLRFQKDKIQYDLRAKNFLKQVSGGGLRFLPVFSKNTIGYAQTRRFVLFNIKKNTHKRYTISKDMSDYPEKVAIIDAKKKHFLIEITHYKSDYDDSCDRILQLIDFGSEKEKVLSSVKLGERDLWTVLDKTIFVYFRNNLRAMNINFEPIEHPFVSLFNNKKETFGFLTQLKMHPSLPFAVFVELKGKRYKSTLCMASWAKNTSDKDQPFITKLVTCKAYNLEYSPDGKWLIFKDSTHKPAKYYLMSVDPELPYFLGEPMLLGEVDQRFSSAWISNPLSFVVSELDKLIKWDITSLYGRMLLKKFQKQEQKIQKNAE